MKTRHQNWRQRDNKNSVFEMHQSSVLPILACCQNTHKQKFQVNKQREKYYYCKFNFYWLLLPISQITTQNASTKSTSKFVHLTDHRHKKAIFSQTRSVENGKINLNINNKILYKITILQSLENWSRYWRAKRYKQSNSNSLRRRSNYFFTRIKKGANFAH